LILSLGSYDHALIHAHLAHNAKKRERSGLFSRFLRYSRKEEHTRASHTHYTHDDTHT